jgi:hypothetical protein
MGLDKKIRYTIALEFLEPIHELLILPAYHEKHERLTKTASGQTCIQG